MSLFKWSKKTVEAMKEEAPPSLPEIKEYEEKVAKKKAEEEDSFYKEYMEEYAKYAYKPGSISGYKPITYGGTSAAATPHGAYIRLDDLQKLYNIEPYAVIKIAEYFAGLGISTEEQAKELIEELKRV